MMLHFSGSLRKYIYIPGRNQLFVHKSDTLNVRYIVPSFPMAAWALTCLLLLTGRAFASANATSTIGSLHAPCLCTFGAVPVPVNVKIPSDPSEGLNTTNLRRLKKTFNIFGEFCQPSGQQLVINDHVQLLLHGSTYTHQYWTFPMNGFQNYSYAAHACSQGQTTFSYDELGVGLSERPLNSTDIQIPVAASIASSLAAQLKDGTLTSSLGLEKQLFKKVVGIAHSQGSVVFNFIAITQGASTTLDAMILTGHIHDQGFLATFDDPKPLASQVDPARWGNLDSGFITTPNRSSFYSPDTSTFSPDVFMLDGLTKDVSTIWYTRELPSVYVPAKGFTGPVVELVGSMDQLHCLNAVDNNLPCNATVLQQIEAPFWPDSRNFTALVREGSGHDVNLDFGAAETFALYSSLVEVMTRQISE